MQYVGVDIVEIERIREAIERFDSRFLEKVFTKAELETYRDKLPSLAARFAGKEAVIKALSCPGISLTDIEILSAADGKPTVTLHDKAKSRAESLALTALDITVSLPGLRRSLRRRFVQLIFKLYSPARLNMLQ